MFLRAWPHAAARGVRVPAGAAALAVGAGLVFAGSAAADTQTVQWTDSSNAQQGLTFQSSQVTGLPSGVQLVAVKNSPARAGELWAVDGSGTVYVIRDGAFVTSFQTNLSGADSISFTNDGQYAFVAASQGNVAVIDAGEVDDDIAAGTDPGADGAVLPGQLTIPGGGAYGTPQASSDGDYLYVPDFSDNLDVFSLSDAESAPTNALPALTIPVGPEPNAMVMSNFALLPTADGDELWVGGNDNGTGWLQELDGATVEADAADGTVPTPTDINGTFTSPSGFALSHDGQSIYVSDAAAGTIQAVSAGSDHTVTALTSQVPEPESMALSSDGNELFVVSGGGSVDVVPLPEDVDAGSVYTSGTIRSMGLDGSTIYTTDTNGNADLLSFTDGLPTMTQQTPTIDDATSGVDSLEDTGTVTAGDQLVVDGVDENGYPTGWDPNAQETYQWYAVAPGGNQGTAIPDATNFYIYVPAAYVGDRFWVQVTGTETGYATAVEGSAATKAAVGAPIDASGAEVDLSQGDNDPTVTAPLPGQTLTASADGFDLEATFPTDINGENNWDYPDLSYSYQWYSKPHGGTATAIQGATGATYKVATADEGHTLSVRVVASCDGCANSAAVASDQTVAVASPQVSSAVPTVSGTPKFGDTLTANAGSWTAGSTLVYRWYENGKAIAGATARTLKLTAAMVGKRITVEVTGSHSGYASRTRTSKAVTVSPATLHGSAKVSFSGSGRVGTKLKATKVRASAFGPGKVTVSYVWFYTTGQSGGPYRTGTSVTVPKGLRGYHMGLEVVVSEAGYQTRFLVSKRVVKVS